MGELRGRAAACGRYRKYRPGPSSGAGKRSEDGSQLGKRLVGNKAGRCQGWWHTLHSAHCIAAPNSPLRAQVTALAEETTVETPSATEANETDGRDALSRSPARYLWATLIARLFEVFPLTCPYCITDYVWCSSSSNHAADHVSPASAGRTVIRRFRTSPRRRSNLLGRRARRWLAAAPALLLDRPPGRR